MLLSQIAGKIVCTDKTPRGICLGVGVSLKSKAVKYLLCTAAAKTAHAAQTDFAVNLSSVSVLSQDAIALSRLRPVFPKNCAKFFIGAPVYSAEGAYLGNVRDLEMQNFIVTRLFTEKNDYPLSSVIAVSDAVILRKTQPYPIGQRIPAPVVCQITSKNEPVVTKSVLRRAIEKGALIKLTLSLAPFDLPLP